MHLVRPSRRALVWTTSVLLIATGGYVAISTALGRCTKRACPHTSSSLSQPPVGARHSHPNVSPSRSASPTPSKQAAIDTQPSLPVRAAFYYPWYPEHWHGTDGT